MRVRACVSDDDDDDGGGGGGGHTRTHTHKRTHTHTRCGEKKPVRRFTRRTRRHLSLLVY